MSAMNSQDGLRHTSLSPSCLPPPNEEHGDKDTDLLYRVLTRITRIMHSLIAFKYNANTKGYLF